MDRAIASAHRPIARLRLSGTPPSDPHFLRFHIPSTVRARRDLAMPRDLAHETFSVILNLTMMTASSSCGKERKRVGVALGIVPLVFATRPLHNAHHTFIQYALLVLY